MCSVTIHMKLENGFIFNKKINEMMLYSFQNSWMSLAIQKGHLNNFNMARKFLLDFKTIKLKKMAKSLKI